MHMKGKCKVAVAYYFLNILNIPSFTQFYSRRSAMNILSHVLECRQVLKSDIFISLVKVSYIREPLKKQ